MANRSAAIAEMARVVRDKGLVMIVDEGVAPWLRESDYGRMMIQNNALWTANPPLDELPIDSVNVRVTWLLENCFYLLEFSKDADFPDVDIDVEHIGQRGGTVRSRFYGALEGVSPESRAKARSQALAHGMSDSQYLEWLIEGDSPGGLQ